MTDKDIRIMNKLREHWDFVKTKYPEMRLMGVFLYGSQNYGVDTDISDVDTKAIYVPSIGEAMSKNWVSKEYTLPDGSHCEVKDIRLMVEMWKKGGINFMEILFTDYYLLNDMIYGKYWQMFRDERDKIAAYNPARAIKDACGRALRILNHESYTNKDKGNLIFLNYFINSYYHNVIGGKGSYKDCIYQSQHIRNYIREVKQGTQFYPDTAVKSMKSTFEWNLKNNCEQERAISERTLWDAIAIVAIIGTWKREVEAGVADYE